MFTKSLMLLLVTFVQSGPMQSVVPPPTGDESIVAANARLELLYTRVAPIHGGLTEGPTTGPDGAIYFSDIPEGADKGIIVRFDPKTETCGYFTLDSMKSNGLAFDGEGFLIACEGADEGGRALAKWDIKTGKRTVLVDRFEGKRFNALNDLTVDSRNRVYFTDPKYLGAEPRELEYRAVYRFDPDGSIREITHAPEKPNGIALSPDEKTLYVADTNNGADGPLPDGGKPKPGAMKVLAFPLNEKGDVNGASRTVWDFGTETGCDGMEVDAEGRLFLTRRSPSKPGVLVVSPEGKELAFIPTGFPQPGAEKPVGLPSNVTFGLGEDRNTLYVTVDMSLYRIKVKTHGKPHPFERK